MKKISTLAVAALVVGTLIQCGSTATPASAQTSRPSFNVAGWVINSKFMSPAILKQVKAAERAIVGKDHVIADGAIVGDVGIGEEIAATADPGAITGSSGAVDAHKFAETVLIADLHIRRLPLVFEILGLLGNGAVGEKAVVAPDAGETANGDVVLEPAAVAEDDVRADDAIRADNDAGTELRGGIDNGSGMNLGCRHGGRVILNTGKEVRVKRAGNAKRKNDFFLPPAPGISRHGLHACLFCDFLRLSCLQLGFFRRIAAGLPARRNPPRKSVPAHTGRRETARRWWRRAQRENRYYQ